MKELKPEIVWRDIDTVREWPHNNKTHPPDQVERIAASIREFGFDCPIVIDGDGVIIKGAGRVLASRHLGLTRVPTIVRTDLSPSEVKASRIADNKAAVSEFDFDGLSIDLAAL
jgi:ParB-like chromosome segregation protein Spo0J